MDVMSVNTVMEYLYDKYIVTFILCLIGAIVREMMTTAKLNNINIKRMIASVITASALMCGVIDYFHFVFSIFAIICIVAGIWSGTILEILMNSKVMVSILKNVAGNVKDPVVKGVASAVTEMESDDAKTKDKSAEIKDSG